MLSSFLFCIIVGAPHSISTFYSISCDASVNQPSGILISGEWTILHTVLNNFYLMEVDEIVWRVGTSEQFTYRPSTSSDNKSTGPMASRIGGTVVSGSNIFFYLTNITMADFATWTCEVKENSSASHTSDISISFIHPCIGQ